MNFFQVYQFLGPLVLLPLGYYLWYSRYDDARFACLALSLPVLYAYIIPALGTNWLRLWEFNTRLRLGRFRPHHGFVFGTATSVVALIALPKLEGALTVAEVSHSAFVLGSVLAFWNWLYDAQAIKVGFIRIYTRTAYEGASAEAITAAYAPALFGTFGACYAVSLRVLESQLALDGQWQSAWWLAALCYLACHVVPVLAYMLTSWFSIGEWGLHSYEGTTHEV